MSEYPKSADTVTEAAIGGRVFMRIAVSSPQFTGEESPEDFAGKYLTDRLRPDDMLVFSSQSIALSQKRYYDLSAVKKTKLAEWASKSVKKTGEITVFGDPKVMSAAMYELGSFRMVVGTLAGRFFGRDSFYRAAGKQSRFIDVLSYDGRMLMTLCPDDAIGVAERIAYTVGCRTLIVDTRKNGGVIAASEEGLPIRDIEAVMLNAPMRVGNRRVPMCIIRER